MASSTKTKKFSFGKLLIWVCVIFLALQIISGGEFGEDLFPEDTRPEVTEPGSTDPAPSTEPVHLEGVPDELQSHVYLNTRRWEVKKPYSGALPITVIFVSDPEGSWSSDEIAAFKEQLNTEAARITTDAARYNVSIDISYHYKTVSIDAVIVDADTVDWVKSALENVGLPKREQVGSTLAQQYGSASAPVIFVANHAGRANATPAYGYAVLYQEARPFYHELSHLYGARDFYFPTDVKTAAATHLENSLMVNSSEGVMDPLNAYLVGWTATPSQKALDFLHDTAHITQEFLNEEGKKETYTGAVTNYTYDGVTYTGYLIDGQLHGQGSYKSETRDVTGTFDHGKLLQGEGTMRYDGGDVYNGQWKNDQRHGYGVYTFAEGGRYEGNWENGVRNGSGKYTSAEGAVWQGTYVDGKLNGQGTFTGSTGNTYVGMFQDGNYHGQGTYTFDNGAKYSGNFVNGQRNGYGVYYYVNGNRYEGNWVSEEKHGYGVMYYASGNRYEGDWADGVRQGQGKLYYADGNYCEGTWADGSLNGQGTFVWADGSRYVGQFRDGKRHGQGTYYYGEGKTMSGWWENGDFIG
ncbi:MAG: hypothetical protein E7470_08175 [Ruminococcaceae bacterium]|nr:hypothetical protein [Oscillospiraceae bacterium]